MLRFTTPVVVTATNRCFATSAILLGRRAGKAVPRGAKIDASNGETRLKARAAKLDARGETESNEELAALRSEYATLRERCKLLYQLAEERHRHLFMVARALRRVDQKYQRDFKTENSLLTIWHTPPERCDAEAEKALQRFLQDSAKWLPQELQLEFFSAWQSIHEQCIFVPQHLQRVKSNRAELKVAVTNCCKGMGDAVCGAFFNIICHLGGSE